MTFELIAVFFFFYNKNSEVTNKGLTARTSLFPAVVTMQGWDLFALFLVLFADMSVFVYWSGIFGVHQF